MILFSDFQWKTGASAPFCSVFIKHMRVKCRSRWYFTTRRDTAVKAGIRTRRKPTPMNIYLVVQVLSERPRTCCPCGPKPSSVLILTFANVPRSRYITTYPDTLIGCWLALERADESNGCLLVADGSNREPIYPERMSDGSERGNLIHAQGAFGDLQLVENTSHLDDSLNTLSHVAEQYGAPVPVEVEAGDVIFFHSHLLHRSHPNGREFTSNPPMLAVLWLHSDCGRCLCSQSNI